MRRRFFVDQIRNGHAEIAGDDARHLTRVLRVEAGQRYEISDNRAVYLAEIETARKEHVIFRTLEKLPMIEPPVGMILCAAIVKFDHFEWMIEKEVWIRPRPNAWNAGGASDSKLASNPGARVFRRSTSLQPGATRWLPRRRIAMRWTKIPPAPCPPRSPLNGARTILSLC